jgi:predicted CXXCH cytochrome family protein
MSLKHLPAALAAAALALGAEAAESRLAPLPPAEAVSTHGPFEMGACDACHDGKDRSQKPGRVVKTSNELCFDCHDEFRKPVRSHPKTQAACLGCHSPHNARKKKLLL